MKKIIALLVSVLMMLSMVAVAEAPAAEELSPSVTFRIDNIVAERTTDGQTESTSLEGFEGYCTIDTSDGLSLIAQAYNGDESLLCAVMKVVGSQLQISFDGMDKAFAEEIPQLAGQDTSVLADAIRPMLPQLVNMALPQMPINDLPKVDLRDFATTLGGETEGDTTTFAMSAEMVSALLSQVVEAVKTAGESVPGIDQALSAIENLPPFALSGQVVDAEDQQTASVNLFPVSDGVVAESPMVILNMTSSLGALVINVDVPVAEAETVNTLAGLSLETDSASNTFVGQLNIISMVSLEMTISQEDGMQKAALSMQSAMTPTISANVVYGPQGDENVFEFSLDMGEENSLVFSSVCAPAEDGSAAGSIELTAINGDNNAHITADFQQYLSSIDMSSFNIPTEVVPYEEINNEENAQALQNAVKPLYDYLSQYVFNSAPAVDDIDKAA